MYRVTDLQACEPDELGKTDGIVITFAGTDRMGFDRVAVYAPTQDALLAYVRENWGDADADWFAEWVVDRVELVSEAPVMTAPDGRLYELELTEKGDEICPKCGHSDVASWADDGEADLADWWQCEKFSGGCGATGAYVDAFQPKLTQNGREAVTQS